MITESSTSIARPPDDVFAFVSDVRNDPKWHTDVLQAWLAGGAGVAAGSTFGVKFKPFMGQSEGTITVSQYEPPRRVVLQGHMGRWSQSSASPSNRKDRDRESHAGSK